MKKHFYSKILFLLILYTTLIIYPVFSEETEESNEEIVNEDPTEEYENALLFGIDSSVIEVLQTMINLKIPGFEELVLERMQETTNSDLVVEGFNYLREIEYDDAIDFSIKIIESYTNLPRRSIQYATFYIKDHSEALTEEQVEYLLDVLLDIVDTDNPGIALSALELIATIYSEKDITYIVQDENNIDKDKKEEYEALMSTQLKERFENTSVSSIKDQILITFGEIQSFNQLDYLIELAESSSTSMGIRSRALRSLAYFTELPEDLTEKRNEIYALTRSNEVPNLRIATLDAFSILLQEEYNETYLSWLQNGLRDSDSNVRETALNAFYQIFSDEVNSDQFSQRVDDTLRRSLEYMSLNDPENNVKSLAIEVLSVYPNNEGLPFLQEQIQEITYLNTIDKSFIEVGIKEIPDKGGVEALITLVNNNIDKSNSSIIKHIAKALATVNNSNDAILSLIDALLLYPEDSVKLDCITAIGKNKFTKYTGTLEVISKDATYSSEIRERAKQVSNLLKQN